MGASDLFKALQNTWQGGEPFSNRSSAVKTAVYIARPDLPG